MDIKVTLKLKMDFSAQFSWDVQGDQTGLLTINERNN